MQKNETFKNLVVSMCSHDRDGLTKLGECASCSIKYILQSKFVSKETKKPTYINMYVAIYEH